MMLSGTDLGIRGRSQMPKGAGKRNLLIFIFGRLPGSLGCPKGGVNYPPPGAVKIARGRNIKVLSGMLFACLVRHGFGIRGRPRMPKKAGKRVSLHA